jgi:hypothetical protein
VERAEGLTERAAAGFSKSVLLETFFAMRGG